MKYNAALRQKLYGPMEGRACGEDPGARAETPPPVNRGSSCRGATDIGTRSVRSGRKRRVGRGGEESLDPVAAVEPALLQLLRIAAWVHGTPAAHRRGHLDAGAKPRSGPGAPARRQAWSSASPQVIGFPEM